jgi:hypothetical protein
MNHFIHQYSSTKIIDVMLDNFIWKMFHLMMMSFDSLSFFIQASILTYHSVSSTHISSYHLTSSNFNFIQSNHFIQILISSINTFIKNQNIYIWMNFIQRWWSNIWCHPTKKIRPNRIWFHPITLFLPIDEFIYPLVHMH